MGVVLVGAQDGDGVVALLIEVVHDRVVCVALQLQGKELQAAGVWQNRQTITRWECFGKYIAYFSYIL